MVKRSLQGSSRSSLGRKAQVDWLSVATGHIHGVAGACLAMGLKFAGSANAQVLNSAKSHDLQWKT